MKASQKVSQSVDDSLVSTSTLAATQLVEITPSELLKKLFKKYDEDKDGRLTKSEFSKILQYLTKITGASFPSR